MLAIRCDVSDDAQVEAMVKQTVATFGGSMQPTTMPAFKIFLPKLLILRETITTVSWGSIFAAYGAA